MPQGVRDRHNKGELCKGLGDKHLIATGQGDTESWSSCLVPCAFGRREGLSGCSLLSPSMGWPCGNWPGYQGYSQTPGQS
jgi:hypothetical protein